MAGDIRIGNLLAEFKKFDTNNDDRLDRVELPKINGSDAEKMEKILIFLASERGYDEGRLPLKNLVNSPELKDGILTVEEQKALREEFKRGL